MMSMPTRRTCRPLRSPVKLVVVPVSMSSMVQMNGRSLVLCSEVSVRLGLASTVPFLEVQDAQLLGENILALELMLMSIVLRNRAPRPGMPRRLQSNRDRLGPFVSMATWGAVMLRTRSRELTNVCMTPLTSLCRLRPEVGTIISILRLGIRATCWFEVLCIARVRRQPEPITSMLLDREAVLFVGEFARPVTVESCLSAHFLLVRTTSFRCLRETSYRFATAEHWLRLLRESWGPSSTVSVWFVAVYVRWVLVRLRVRFVVTFVQMIV